MNKNGKFDEVEPSRRRLLKGVGALGGALALAGGCPVAHAAKPQSAPGTLSPQCPHGDAAFLRRSSVGHSDAAAGLHDAGSL